MGKLIDSITKECNKHILVESWTIMFQLEDLLDEAAKEFPYSSISSKKNLMVARHLWFRKWFGESLI